MSLLCCMQKVEGKQDVPFEHPVFIIRIIMDHIFGLNLNFLFNLNFTEVHEIPGKLP